MATAAAVNDIPELTLGTRLYMARKKAGLEQQDIADAAGVSRALVSQWERDKGAGPRHSHIEKVAAVTGVPARWLHVGYALESVSGYRRDSAGLESEKAYKRETAGHLALVPDLDGVQTELPFTPPPSLTVHPGGGCPE